LKNIIQNSLQCLTLYSETIFLEQYEVNFGKPLCVMELEVLKISEIVNLEGCGTMCSRK